jgi:hypothetical protein
MDDTDVTIMAAVLALATAFSCKTGFEWGKESGASRSECVARCAPRASVMSEGVCGCVDAAPEGGRQ